MYFHVIFHFFSIICLGMCYLNKKNIRGVPFKLTHSGHTEFDNNRSGSLEDYLSNKNGHRGGPTTDGIRQTVDIREVKSVN